VGDLLTMLAWGTVALAWGKAAFWFGLAYCAWRIARRF